MNCPEDFKQRCKEIYPGFDRLHLMIETGSRHVGLLLNGKAEEAEKLLCDIVVHANTLEEVKRAVTEIKSKQKLYLDWCNIYNSQKEY